MSENKVQVYENSTDMDTVTVVVGQIQCDAKHDKAGSLKCTYTNFFPVLWAGEKGIKFSLSRKTCFGGIVTLW